MKAKVINYRSGVAGDLQYQPTTEVAKELILMEMAQPITVSLGTLNCLSYPTL